MSVRSTGSLFVMLAAGLWGLAMKIGQLAGGALTIVAVMMLQFGKGKVKCSAVDMANIKTSARGLPLALVSSQKSRK